MNISSGFNQSVSHHEEVIGMSLEIKQVIKELESQLENLKDYL